MKLNRFLETIFLTNTLYKLAGYASVLLIFDYLRKGSYSSLWPMAVTVAILTMVGAIADMTIVPRMGNIPSLVLGAPAMVIIIWGTARFWPASHISLLAAIVLALCIAPLEYALHRYVLRSIE